MRSVAGGGRGKLRAAARVLMEAAWAAADEEDPAWDPAARGNLVECGCGGCGEKASGIGHRASGGEAERGAGGECELCGGIGWVKRARGSGELPDALMESVGDFLVERAFIAEHGLGVWITVHGEPDAWFIEALSVFGGEVERLERGRRVEAAARVKK